MIENAKVVDVFGRELYFTRQGRMGVELSWLDNDRLISKKVVDRQKQSLMPCITPKGDGMVLVFGELEGLVSPYDACIFNANGSVRVHLIPPKLISEEFKEYEIKVGKIESQKNIRFLWPYYFKKDGHDFLVIAVGFNNDWYEIRELNPNTGKFGQCFGATKQ
ncbi:hypothetical protein MYP_4057 [Sporocytophaga myxococcoides]|uniref:Uncharacterized protein n=1 Tax=Sporocytophaga myxococcoides TaxID=153721 RepID=A0A098LKI0_9BACT|nr:hypothetical protein [Sporocytophaga myxococcoides]GAL86827.1 hypothetical protein MYP_4057 [Sporocytophaga myxococcoides]